jgi:hypothetical protein
MSAATWRKVGELSDAISRNIEQLQKLPLQNAQVQEEQATPCRLHRMFPNAKNADNWYCHSRDSSAVQEKMEFPKTKKIF